MLGKAGLENQTVVFLFSDSQIVQESFLEDINNILNTGEVPSLWAPDEMDNILNTCRPLAQMEGGKLDKNSVYQYFVRRCQRNIHIVLAMSPIGDTFRNRLRQFPSLINCCTIDWFAEWPDEALVSVARDALSVVQLPDDQTLSLVVMMCMYIHQSVATKSKQYLTELRRYNYVTPTSYLELLNTYKTLLDVKRDEVGMMRKRLSDGLAKLEVTAVEVGEQTSCAAAAVEKTTIEVEEMMVVIQDTEQANIKRKEVSEEAGGRFHCAGVQIADEAQTELDKALPALEAATESLAAEPQRHH